MYWRAPIFIEALLTPRIVAPVVAAALPSPHVTGWRAANPPRTPSTIRRATASKRPKWRSAVASETAIAGILKLVDYVHVVSNGQVVYSAKPEDLRGNKEIKSNYLGMTLDRNH